MILLSSLSVHPILTLIITMEISIFSFFIILYSFAVHRYIPFILWPISVSKGRWGVPESRTLIMCVSWHLESHRRERHTPPPISVPGSGAHNISGAQAEAAGCKTGS